MYMAIIVFLFVPVSLFCIIIKTLKLILINKNNPIIVLKVGAPWNLKN